MPGFLGQQIVREEQNRPWTAVHRLGNGLGDARPRDEDLFVIVSPNRRQLPRFREL